MKVDDDGMNTKRSAVVFTAKETKDGMPHIVIENLRSNLGFTTGDFGFDLFPGATLADAQSVAKFLRRNITHFSHRS